MIADFVSGAAEKLVLANQHHEVIVVEGQGSLFHPRYSCVTLGLLHGLMPDGLVLCYEMGRTAVSGMERFRCRRWRRSRVLRGGGQHHASLPRDRRGRQRPEVPRRRGGRRVRPRRARAWACRPATCSATGPDKLVKRCWNRVGRARSARTRKREKSP